ncbi:T9SS type A sorting domain-containing protein [Dokdonia pacifica]|uniref:Por secretion system C-terminal sorting domain-containing protein n=1 Tax=Dokdonia pacifica TaxID=1627892 RepID=A0A238WQA9_9FLAO|nr:T9SS type A sorting domain-containing protein [Dokdonia pacifica]SNR48790.1 Por secretion system C-terminal sorting domain-containing protein [Dokdonia pacifica]
MKKITLFILCLFGAFTVYAQDGSMSPTSYGQAEYMREIPALSSMDNIIAAAGFEHVAPPKRRGSNTFIPGKGLPAGPDPLLQKQGEVQAIQGRAPVASFGAHQGTVLNDPTGAIGPNHYVYAFNSGFGILDRSGNVLLPEASLGTIFPGETLGDPVVVYDRYADRFIIMQFSNTPNGFLIAVGQGPDPVNDGWFTYRFNTGSFPDYEKLSIWSDGYYITANKDQGSITTSEVVFAVERDEMLVGNPNAQLIGFPLPGASNNGFYSPGGFNATGPTLPPVGVPHPIVYMQDDSWSGVSQDHLKVWDISVNWNNPTSSSISSPQQINTASFDAVFNGGSFNNLDEPGSGPNIDAIQATMMYMTNYRRFGTHNSAVMNFVVDVSGNDTRAGIRWYELRQTGDNQPWTIYQEGTYSQPSYSVFCGSIGMDFQGNIGLGYTIVSNSIFTSLRYTGRLASDPLGTMTVAEQNIVDGNAQTNRPDGRYGDYSQLTIDPTDDLTFWHIGEYMNGSAATVRKSHVAAFQIGSAVPDSDPPSTPTSLAASNTTATSTDLSWNASTDNIGVTGYDVYQDGVVVGTASGTSFTVTGLSPTTTYSFFVIAKDAAGNQSGQSNSVSVTTGAITACTGGISSFPYSESFESSLGDWTQATGDDLNWTRDSGGTPSNNTGPSSGADGAFYIYVEASGNGTGFPNKQAIINSPCYDLSNETEATFSFQYHMFGSSDAGSIALEASNDNGLSWTAIWSQTGNQGNQWNTVSLNLAAYVGSGVQLRFNRVTGGTWQADVAIDDIALTTSGGGPGTGCSGGITAFPYAESFESSLGAWSQATGDDLNWTRDSGGTPSNNTGPSTGADGAFYVYVEASGNGTGFPNKQAILNSPCFDLNSASQATFSFQYHMFGSTDAGSIDLEASNDDGNTWTSIWNQTGNQGNQWNTVTLDLAAYVGGGLQLRFNRVTGGTWQADVAIDDISLTTDGGPGNDCAAGDLTLTINLDNYPEETAWTLTSGGATVASNSYSTANPDGSTVVENINGLSSGDYTFTITDSFGDGICCGFGNGSYTLESSEGVIASGGDFGASDVTAFCVDDTKSQALRTQTLAREDNNLFRIFPNPAERILNIDVQDKTIDNIKVFSMLGMLVSEINDSDIRSIDVSNYKSGTYFVRITSGDITITRRFIKK